MRFRRVGRLAEHARVALAGGILTLSVRRSLARHGFQATVERLYLTGPRWVRSTLEGPALLRAVRRVGRVLPGRDTCLVRALVLVRLLHDAGRPASVVLGVRAGERPHAWVACPDGSELDRGEGCIPVLTVDPWSRREAA